MGELPRMSAQQYRRAKALIRRLCANYDGGCCLLLEDGCPQLLTPALVCKYFRAAVLPADRELHDGLMGAGPVRRCRVCGAPVVSRSNAAKYCPSCALRERRRQDRERKAAPRFRK